MYVRYHYETRSYFFVDFVRFSRYVERLLRPQSVEVPEKIVQFSWNHFSQTENLIQSHSFLLHSSISYILYSSHCHHFVRFTQVRCVNSFLEIILLTCGCLFLPQDDWRADGKLSTETSLCSLTALSLMIWVKATISREFGWCFFPKNLDGCWRTDGCRTEGLSVYVV